MRHQIQEGFVVRYERRGELDAEGKGWENPHFAGDGSADDDLPVARGARFWHDVAKTHGTDAGYDLARPDSAGGGVRRAVHPSRGGMRCAW